MKNFVKRIDREGPCFKYLSEPYPRLSKAKTKEGIFTGPDIRRIMRDPEFAEAEQKRSRIVEGSK